MIKFIFSILTALSVFSAPPTAASGADLASLKAQYVRPDVRVSSPPGPLEKQKISLGKSLFFDPQLSGNNALSCASCHDPKASWQDSRGRSIGATGQKLSRTTPTIMDAGWRNIFMWDGRFLSLEKQVWGPITSPVEMNQGAEDLVTELQASPDYQQKFGQAFPRQGISLDTIASALAAFERTVRSPVTPFDRWVAGDHDAISPAAVRGFQLFNGKANCKACHGGWMFTDNQFHDIGLPGDDLGRGAFEPNEPQMQRAFKTPTLRNIAVRAPYMHDGSKKTLADVLRHYEDGIILRTSLSDQIMAPRLSAPQTADLIAFLNALN